MKKPIIAALVCLVVGLGAILWAVLKPPTVAELEQRSILKEKFSEAEWLPHSFVGVGPFGWNVKDMKGNTIFSKRGKHIERIEEKIMELSPTVRELEITTVASTVRIERLSKGEKPKISYLTAYEKEGKILYEALVTEKEGVLKIQDDFKEALNGDMKGNGALKEWKERLQNGMIILSLPEDYALSRASLKNSFGTLNIEMLTADVVEMNVDAGSVNLRNINSKEFGAKIGAGDLIIEDSQLGRVNMHLGAGKIDVRKTDLAGGKIEVEMGDCVVRESGIKNLEIQVEMGKGTLQGTMTGKISAQVDMGELNLRTDLPREDYTINAEAKMGDIRINGEEFSGAGNGGDHSLILKTDMGTIDIRFEEGKAE